MIGTPASAPAVLPWLLSGPPASAGPEPLTAHTARLGPEPAAGPHLIAALADGGLRGRGGARFPAWRKWEVVAQRSCGRAEVVVNGGEGEPASGKDHALMLLRPHLVLDGASLAARSVGATEVVVYVNRSFVEASASLRTAIGERRRAGDRTRFRLVEGPGGYVSGEETAVVRFLNGGEAKPAFTPPRPFESGVRGRPTLVQNVETLSLAALIARFGPSWFRSAGTAASPGPLLVTVGGAVARPGVYEIAHGAALAGVAAMAGGDAAAAPGVLLGGCFGRWVPGHQAAAVVLDDDALAHRGMGLGCGVVTVLHPAACGVAETAGLLEFMAGASSGQCGPCLYGLASVAATVRAVAGARGHRDDLWRLRHWSEQLEQGRGACKHPDGAVALLRSALVAFEGDFDHHVRHGSCGNRR